MSQGSHHPQQTPPAAPQPQPPPPPESSSPETAPPPPAPCNNPIQNKLLIRYDPTKILGRPSLLATLGSSSKRKKSELPQPQPQGHWNNVPGNRANVNVGVNVNVNVNSTPRSDSSLSGKDKGQSQGGGEDRNKKKDLSLMPPPRFPPPTSVSRVGGSASRLGEEEGPSSSKKCAAAARSEADGSGGGGGIPRADEDGSTSTSTSSSSKNLNLSSRKQNLAELSGYTYPKVGLGSRSKSSSRRKRVISKRNCVVKYEEEEAGWNQDQDEEEWVSPMELRISAFNHLAQSTAARAATEFAAQGQSNKRTKFTQRREGTYPVSNSSSSTTICGDGDGRSGKSQTQVDSSTAGTSSGGSGSSGCGSGRAFTVPSKVGDNVKHKEKQTEQGPGLGTDKKVEGGSSKMSDNKAASSRCERDRDIFTTYHKDILIKLPENYLVTHTIELLRHKRDLQGYIELMQSEGIILRISDLPKLKDPLPRGQLQIPNIPMQRYQTKEVIQNRLTILMAHRGYTHATQVAIEVLADVMENFYTSMAHRLKQVREAEMMGCEQEFPDPVERVMMEFNMGGVRGLQRYYKSGVIDYRKRVEEQCINLRAIYANKIKSKVGMVSCSSVSNISSFSSTSTSSTNNISPGNSVLTDILCGLEGAKASEGRPPTFEQDEKMRHLNLIRPPMDETIKNVGVRPPQLLPPQNPHPNAPSQVSQGQSQLSSQHQHLPSPQNPNAQSQVSHHVPSPSNSQPHRQLQQIPSSSSHHHLPPAQQQPAQSQNLHPQSPTFPSGSQTLSQNQTSNQSQSQTQLKQLIQQPHPPSTSTHQIQHSNSSSPGHPKSSKLSQPIPTPHLENTVLPTSIGAAAASATLGLQSHLQQPHPPTPTLKSTLLPPQTKHPAQQQHQFQQKTQLSSNPGNKMARPIPPVSGSSPKSQSQILPNKPSIPYPIGNSSMVSINLNNNVDLGGFIPITSPGASARTPTLNVNKGMITCGSGGGGGSGSGGGDSKAKLKEALSQRNLLRLNFEQVPSSCDSTVLLSSSSPSLSSSGSPANKSSTPASSSLSQTTRLKL